MARQGDYRGAQAHAKVWNKTMKSNINNEEAFDNY
jgi:hypothetical protein